MKHVAHEHPTKSVATLGIVENGETKIKFWSFFWEAKYVAPPLPIDLPIIIVLFLFTDFYLLRYKCS